MNLNIVEKFIKKQKICFIGSIDDKTYLTQNQAESGEYFMIVKRKRVYYNGGNK